MRATAAFAILSALPLSVSAQTAADKLTVQDRIELTRGLTAEYATAKVLLPRSKKPLQFDDTGTYDKKAWADIARESGPAARTGDLVQVTKIDIQPSKLVLEINGGFKGGRKWYQGIQIAGGPSSNPTPVAVGGNDTNAPGGTSIEITYHKSMEGIKAAEVKKLLASVLDFEKRSATEIYSETLPPETQKAIKDKRVIEGMTHDQVRMAAGVPAHKSREVKDGMELEDWVYGTPPGKITFVTFNGDKVIKVKDLYAGLGTEVKQDVIR